MATFTGVAIFIGARIADRHSCVVLNSSTTTRVITVGSAASRPSRWLPVRLNKNVGGVFGEIWILDQHDGRRWIPTWQLIGSVNGGPGDVRRISDVFDIAGVGLGGPATIRFLFPDGLRSGTYRLRPVRNADAPALTFTAACRSGLIAEWYGKVALALHS